MRNENFQFDGVTIPNLQIPYLEFFIVTELHIPLPSTDV